LEISCRGFGCCGCTRRGTRQRTRWVENSLRLLCLRLLPGRLVFTSNAAVAGNSGEINNHGAQRLRRIWPRIWRGIRRETRGQVDDLGCHGRQIGRRARFNPDSSPAVGLNLNLPIARMGKRRVRGRRGQVRLAPRRDEGRDGFRSGVRLRADASYVCGTCARKQRVGTFPSRDGNRKVVVQPPHQSVVSLLRAGRSEAIGNENYRTSICPSSLFKPSKGINFFFCEGVGDQG
jgi:hypothetical protein